MLWNAILGLFLPILLAPPGSNPAMFNRLVLGFNKSKALLLPVKLTLVGKATHVFCCGKNAILSKASCILYL